MFHSLKTLIPQTLSKHKIASSAGATLICQETDKIIADIIGADVSALAKAIYVKDNTIAIEADSSAVISELKLYTEAIIETVNEKFPKADIKGLRFLMR